MEMKEKIAKLADWIREQTIKDGQHETRSQYLLCKIPNMLDNLYLGYSVTEAIELEGYGDEE